MKKLLIFLLFSFLTAEISNAQVHSRREIGTYTAAEICQLRTLMISFLSSPTGLAVIQLHANTTTFAMIHCYNEMFLTWHREHIRHHIEEFLLTQDGGSKFVPLPEWNPTTTIPGQFFNSGGGGCPGNAVVIGAFSALTDQTPNSPITYNFTRFLNTPTLCSYVPGVLDPIGSKPSRPGSAIDNFGLDLQQEHNKVHVAIGGVMGNGSSPAAAIFYLWHSYVDDIYRKYQCDCQAGKAKDLYIADSNEDIGEEPNAHSSLIYLSPEIWVRNTQDVTTTICSGRPRYTQEDIVLRHQNPEAGQANYIYVRIRNIGCAQTLAGEVNLKVYFSKGSTGLTWPTSWVANLPFGDEITASPVSIPSLNPGESYVAEVQWFPPDPAIFSETQSHICLLARLESTVDPMAFVETTDIGANTANNNNIAWKNTEVVNINPFAPPPAPGISEFVFDVIQPITMTDPIKLTFTKAGNFQLNEVILRANPGVMDTFLMKGKPQGMSLLTDPQGNPYFSIKEQTAFIEDLPLKPGARVSLELSFNLRCSDQGGFPCARLGDVYRYNVEQFTQGVFGDGFVGGVGYEIRIQENKQAGCDDLITNSSVELPTCQNMPSGKIALNITGQQPHIFYWSNGANTRDIASLLPGKYEVTVVDGKNCMDTMSFQLRDLSDLKIEFTVKNPHCDVPNGSVSAKISGGTPPYAFLWSDGSQGLSIKDLNVGVYGFMVTDSKGCQRSDSVLVGQVFPFGGLTLGTDASSPVANDGSAQVVLTSGVAPYVINWSNGATTDLISNLAPADYIVTATDALGCTFIDTVTVSFIDATGELTLDRASVELFPNPVNHEIEILIKNWNVGLLQISITDVAGKKVKNFNRTAQSGLIRVDLNGLPAGLYYLTLDDGHRSISKKFTKI